MGECPGAAVQRTLDYTLLEEGEEEWLGDIAEEQTVAVVGEQAGGDVPRHS